MRQTTKTFLQCALALTVSGSAMATPITSSADPALAGATVQTFESLSLGYQLGPLVLGNLTITPHNVGGLYVDLNNGQYAPPTDHALLNYDGQGYVFTFTNAVSAFAMQIGATNYVQTLSVYDALNNLIESISIPDQVSTMPYPYSGYYGVNAGSASIAWATLTANFSDIWVIDDLTYTTGPSTGVPEPGSLALASLALLGLSALRRRRG